MERLETVVRRRTQSSVLERKRADETVKPFVGALRDWNAKAAHLRVRVESAYSSEEERTLARLECGTLLAEIRNRQSDFRSAIEAEPSHSRLDDVAAAFQRLIEQLQGVSGIANEASPR